MMPRITCCCLEVKFFIAQESIKKLLLSGAEGNYIEFSVILWLIYFLSSL